MVSVVRISAVDFLNVGQGDAAIVSLEGGWRGMFDGGRERDLRPFIPALLRGRMDLVVGTHFDADHLEGLAAAIEQGMDAGHVIVPAQVHPTGETVTGHEGWGGAFNVESPLLAHHFAAGRSLESAYQSLEERAVGLVQSVSSLEADIRGAQQYGSAEPAGGSGALEAEQSATASDIASNVGLPSISRVLEVASRGAARPEFRSGGLRPFFRGASALSREVISASSLKRLIDALEARRIPWSAPTAPDLATPAIGSVASNKGLKSWHVAPTHRYVDYYASHVRDVWDRVLRLMALEVDTGLPTLSNRLSHVFVLEDAHGAVLVVCGDSGFHYGRRVPDSMSTGWQEPFGRANLLHLPHHGGRWGRFGSRARRALSSHRGHLSMYVSVGLDRSDPPGRAVAPFAKGVTHGRGGQLLLANVPKGNLGSLVRRRTGRTGSGPAILRFTRTSIDWTASGVEVDDTPSSIAPISVSLP